MRESWVGAVRCVLLLAVFLTRPALAGPPDAASDAPRPVVAQLPFEELTLPNGLRVIFHEDHRTPQVAVNVRYRVGFSDDPPGRRGLAHLFEHLMLRGSKHVGRDKFFVALERAGASDRNATTSLDATKYFETLPANQLALALWLESDRMGFFLDTLDQTMLDKEKEVVRNEYRLGMLDKPYSFVARFVRNAVFPQGHPYHWRIEGEMDDTDAITLDDLRTFFRRYCAPSNATLTIAGDIDRARARALVTRYFGTLPVSIEAAGLAPLRPSPIASEVRLDVESAAEAPRLVIGWAGPAELTEGDVSLDLVSDVLARPKAGRLYDALVREAAIADSTDVSSDVMGVRHGRILWLKVELKKGVDPVRALEVVDRVIDDFRTKGPRADEVAQAKARWTDRLLWSLERNAQRADLLNDLDWSADGGRGLERIQSFAATATPDSLRDAAARWLPKNRRAIAFVKHAAGAPVGGRLVTR